MVKKEIFFVSYFFFNTFSSIKTGRSCQLQACLNYVRVESALSYSGIHVVRLKESLASLVFLIQIIRSLVLFNSRHTFTCPVSSPILLLYVCSLVIIIQFCCYIYIHLSQLNHLSYCCIYVHLSCLNIYPVLTPCCCIYVYLQSLSNPAIITFTFTCNICLILLHLYSLVLINHLYTDFTSLSVY